MKVAILCEFSGVVREAFRARGHDAWSFDLLPAEDGSKYHVQGDITDVVPSLDCWDLAICHPPCTHLSVSGARHFEAKRADGRQQAAIAFFMMCVNAPCTYVCVENPVCIMSTLYRKPDQIIQPYEYGHGETKATCLWLRGLKKLVPTNIVAGREQRVHRLPPSPDRWKLRSKTFEGVAKAMANQWG